jgi:isorenieratene synthase
LRPVEEHLLGLGASIHRATPVRELRVEKGGFVVNGEDFDKVVVSSDVVGARSIVGQAVGVPDALREQFEKLRPGQRYAVYRVWLDRDPRKDVPMFVITERTRVLDSVTFYHRYERETLGALQAELNETGKQPAAVLELHCYSVPDDLPDEEVKAALLGELFEHFPEIDGARVLDEHFQLRQDFTAFHVGMNEERPTVETGVKSPSTLTGVSNAAERLTRRSAMRSRASPVANTGSPPSLVTVGVMRTEYRPSVPRSSDAA